MSEKVCFARVGDYEAGNLKTALETVLAEQIASFGGVSGKRIMLKPNLLAWRRAWDIACVHPAVIVETSRLFLDAGAKEVAVLENPAVQTAPAILHSMGIADELTRLGVHYANFEKYRKLEMIQYESDYDRAIRELIDKEKDGK